MQTPRYVLLSFFVLLAAGAGLGALIVYRALYALTGLFGS